MMVRSFSIVVGIALAGLAVTAHFVGLPQPASAAASQFQSRCASLAQPGRFPAAKVISATVIPADAATMSPEFCEVVAETSPDASSKIGLVFRLPENWNGKLLGLGGGGFAGNVTLVEALPALARGYSTLQTDAGHPSAQPWDTSWAVKTDGTPNVSSLLDFGFRAVHEMAVIGKQVVTAYYGRPIRHAYFQGCSQGGRQGMEESQRYPTDFDGIISGAPAFNDESRVSMSLISRAFRPVPSKLSRVQIQLVNSAVLRACDSSDGLADGIINNPRLCRWDPAELTCKSKKADDTCLTLPQVAAVRAAYADHTGPSGQVTAFGLPRGSELSSFPFFMAMTHDSQTVTGYNNLGVSAGLKPDTDYDSNDVLADHEEQRNSLFGVTYLAENPDISAFVQRGGKLLLWQGLYDQLLPPQALFDYYANLQRVTHAQLAATGDDSKLNDGVVLFAAVGVAHCFGGAGPSDFDGLSVLENWVEKGETPTRIVAHQLSPQMTAMAAAMMGNLPRTTPDVMTRPLCRWPALPLYKGAGDPNDAANFECK